METTSVKSPPESFQKQRVETLSKLESLKELYESGFITHTEYKVCLMQLILILVGTKIPIGGRLNRNEECCQKIRKTAKVFIGDYN